MGSKPALVKESSTGHQQMPLFTWEMSTHARWHGVVYCSVLPTSDTPVCIMNLSTGRYSLHCFQIYLPAGSFSQGPWVSPLHEYLSRQLPKAFAVATAAFQQQRYQAVSGRGLLCWLAPCLWVISTVVPGPSGLGPGSTAEPKPTQSGYKIRDK